MAELKTKPTAVSVSQFIAALPDEGRRKDCTALVKLMKSVTRKEPRMWGPSMVGFGDYHYKYDSGREGDMFVVGFSPRVQQLSIYLMGGYRDRADLLDSLGKYKTAKGCLYIKRLEDVDLPTLKKLVEHSYKQLKTIGKEKGAKKNGK